MQKWQMTSNLETGGPRRLAVISGSYGNVPALEAAITDARAEGCTDFAFLGDAIGCCGHSNEVIGMIRTHFPILVAGNHEQQAAAGELTCGCGYASAEDERISCLAFERACEDLTDENRVWLGTWPDLVRLEIGSCRLLLVHGSPDQTNEFLYNSTLDDDRIVRWLDEHDVDAIIGTHTGLPWHRPLPNGTWMANAGVVGKPDNDGDPAVHYGIVDCTGGAPSFALRRISYDHTAWADQLDTE